MSELLYSIDHLIHYVEVVRCATPKHPEERVLRLTYNGPQTITVGALRKGEYALRLLGENNEVLAQDDLGIALNRDDAVEYTLNKKGAPCTGLVFTEALIDTLNKEHPGRWSKI